MKLRKCFKYAVISASVFMSSAAVNAAEVIYDSSPANPNGNQTSFAYAANRITEFGNEITVAGSNRVANDATVRFRTGPNGSPAIPNDVDFTLTFYNSIGSDAFASKTITFGTPAGVAGSTASERPFFDVVFALADMGIVLPETFFYGVSIDPFANATTQSLNLALWAYNDGGAVFDKDGDTIKTGTDKGRYWFRRADGGLRGTFPTASFTPNFTLTASEVGAVPEPGTWAMMLLGFGFVGGAMRRKGKKSSVAVSYA